MLSSGSKDTLENEAWQRYCYFLRLSLPEFQGIQNELLEESLRLLASSSLGRGLLGGKVPTSSQQFREVVPLTSYQEYANHLDRKDDSVLPEKPVFWAYTSTSGGAGKWVPYTATANQIMLDHLMAGLLLASSNEPGEGQVNAGDAVMYNLAPRPYMAGYLGYGMCQRFGLRSVPPLEKAESMDISERVEKGFESALRGGLDFLCSPSSVLVKMGERFADHQVSRRFSLSYLHPAVLFRLARAYASSRLSRRPLLPKDLFRLKGIIGWGLDTSLYRQAIKDYWGLVPYEFHACTEAGILALQGWNKKGLTLLPRAAFFEFIPEKEWARSQQEKDYQPATVLLDEVEVGQRYELVLTSFHGMPFVRYRIGHLIMVLSRDDQETGVNLPQIAFVGRSDGVIDLAGFTRLDETTLGRAIYQSQFYFSDWIATKEYDYHDTTPNVHIYVEAGEDVEEAAASARLHQNLKDLDPPYRDLESMLGLKPLRVSLLAPGTFQRYYQERRRLGQSLMEARLPHVNTPPAAVQELLQISNCNKR